MKIRIIIHFDILDVCVSCQRTNLIFCIDLQLFIYLHPDQLLISVPILNWEYIERIVYTVILHTTRRSNNNKTVILIKYVLSVLNTIL